MNLKLSLFIINQPGSISIFYDKNYKNAIQTKFLFNSRERKENTQSAQKSCKVLKFQNF